MGHEFAGIRQARQHWGGQRRALGGGHVGGETTTTTTDFFGFLFPTTTTSTEPHTSSTTSTTTTSTTQTLLPATTTSTTSTTTSSSTSTTSSTTTTTSTSSSRVSSTSTTSFTTSSSSSFHLETPTTTASTHTVAVTVSASVAGSAASASTSTTPKGATSNTGTIIGGVAAGILGFAFLLAALAFILRRMRRKKDEQIDFDPNSFRRSAVQIQDNDVFNPRPPVMTENRSNAAMSFGTMYGAPGPQQQPRQEYAQPYYTPSAPPSNVNSANPLFAPAMYGHNQYSPQPSPMAAGMYPSYSDEGHAVGSPLTRQPSAHTVNSAYTSGPVQYATYPAVPAPSTREEPLPTGDYADLERSSVTPFQAAQYVEIARRMDSEPPRGLDTPAVEAYIHRRNDSLPPVPPKDPFDDPSSAKSESRHLSTATASSDVMAHGELDFPVPPSPAHTTSSRYRIDSTPPSLPELKIDSHHSVSSYDFPSSIRASDDSTFMSTGPKKDIAPSPLANSFSATRTEPKPRPETVYDMEDAYGGIN